MTLMGIVIFKLTNLKSDRILMWSNNVGASSSLALPGSADGSRPTGDPRWLSYLALLPSLSVLHAEFRGASEAPKTDSHVHPCSTPPLTPFLEFQHSGHAGM